MYVYRFTKYFVKKSCQSLFGHYKSGREIVNYCIVHMRNCRYKKLSVGRSSHAGRFLVQVRSLRSRDGALLDPDDRVGDVCDDREHLMAVFEEQVRLTHFPICSFRNNIHYPIEAHCTAGHIVHFR